MIEEEKTSVKGTGKASSLHSKPNLNSENSLLPKPQAKNATLKPTLPQSANFKKLIVFFIAIALSLMVAAVYNYSFKKTKHKPKAKPKSKVMG